ncbi:MAG TPA: lycopene cyclase family protein [Flavisolibacter sp.]|nr:lycopene cyclase family protein [Flavisolibacter sp.]
MSVTLQYDYIIAGAGCAGLSLAMHLIHSGKFRDKNILLVDQHPKQSNDRTWCFWQTGKSLFEPIVYKQWQKLFFYGEAFSKQLNIEPYKYKMIRGIDFYDFCLEEINRQPNFTVRFDKVEHVFSSDITTGIMLNGNAIHAEYIFNSILFQKPQLSENEYWLLQHFKGWLIETENNVFEPEVATLMDFRIDQQWGTAFCYVLPFTKNRALVEYTVFSPQVLPKEQYDVGLKNYLEQILQLGSYKILDEEFGVIPMTNFEFDAGQNNIINIGTAGGQTKGSSGYTFNFIQKHSNELVQQLMRGKHPSLKTGSRRFSFYDSVLLNILYKNTLPGKLIFTRLFQKNQTSKVLRFLDNETSVADELKIISTLPTWPFTKAALQQIF